MIFMKTSKARFPRQMSVSIKIPTRLLAICFKKSRNNIFGIIFVAKVKIEVAIKLPLLSKRLSRTSYFLQKCIVMVRWCYKSLNATIIYQPIPSFWWGWWWSDFQTFKLSLRNATIIMRTMMRRRKGKRNIFDRTLSPQWGPLTHLPSVRRFIFSLDLWVN